MAFASNILYNFKSKLTNSNGLITHNCQLFFRDVKYYKLHYYGNLWSTCTFLLFRFHMHWRRKWQPTPVFLPGGLPSIGSHRVGHDWSDLAAGAVTLGKSFNLSEFSLFICKLKNNKIHFSWLSKTYEIPGVVPPESKLTLFMWDHWSLRHSATQLIYMESREPARKKVSLGTASGTAGMTVD